MPIACNRTPHQAVFRGMTRQAAAMQRYKDYYEGKHEIPSSYDIDYGFSPLVVQ
ncbi:MAG TPA: hypothetical protein PLK94_10815 [Alphaproteobacteria bacterium]|nr:hypothetical protein [Alphaproteobacteria bacterium]